MAPWEWLGAAGRRGKGKIKVLWRLGRASPGRRMDTQILLPYSCAPPLQTLVEPRFNFRLHFLSLRHFLCLCPPNHPRRQRHLLVSSAAHPPVPNNVWALYIWLRPGPFGGPDCIVWLGPALSPVRLPAI